MLSKKRFTIQVEGNRNSITRFLVPDPTLPTQSNKRNQLSQEGALESVDSIQILLALVLFGKNVQGVFASSVRDQIDLINLPTLAHYGTAMLYLH